MTSHKICAEVSDWAAAMRIAGALQDLIEPAPGALTVFEDPGADGEVTSWRIEAYYEEPPEPQALADRVAALIGGAAPRFRTESVPEANWVAVSQAALPPVRAGRYTIHGGHDAGRVARGPNAIQIEAGEAFGTAHHATTFGCLLALDKLARAHVFRRILDLGCGSGVLAIAAARAWPAAGVAAVDIDPCSVAVATANARVNGAGRRIRVMVSMGPSSLLTRRSAPFDLIVANILTEPLIKLAPHLRRSLARGGTLVLSGLLNSETARVTAVYRAQGLAIVSTCRHNGWPTLVLAKRPVARGRRRP